MFHCFNLSWNWKHIWGLWCQKQVSQAGISNCIPQNMWDAITYPYLGYLLLALKSSYDVVLRTVWKKLSDVVMMSLYDDVCTSSLYDENPLVTGGSLAKYSNAGHWCFPCCQPNQWLSKQSSSQWLETSCAHTVMKHVYEYNGLWHKNISSFFHAWNEFSCLY